MLRERRPNRPNDDLLCSVSCDNKSANQDVVARFHARASRYVHRLRRRRLHAKNPAAVRQIIKRTVRSDVQMDRAGNYAGKITCRIVGRIQHPDPTTAQVGEEILPNETARKLQDRRIIKRSADNGTASRAARPVSVVKDRVPEIWIRRRSRTFCRRPAIVRSGNTIINFLPRALTNVVNEQASGSRLKRERKWVAQTYCPNRAVGAGS